MDFNAEKIRPRLGKRIQNYVSKRSEEFEIEKIRPRLGKRFSDFTSFGKRNTNYEVEKIRPRLGKRFSYKSPGSVRGSGVFGLKILSLLQAVTGNTRWSVSFVRQFACSSAAAGLSRQIFLSGEVKERAPLR